MIIPRQSSFDGGEAAPGLWERDDLKRYADALRLCRNALPLQEGPVTNRAGFLYSAQAITSDPANPVRLKEFVFSSGTIGQAFVLEFAATKIRVFKLGVVMAIITTDYTAAEVNRLKFVQSGQVLSIACKGKATRDLTWIADDNWTLTDRTVTRAITPPTGLALGVATNATTATLTALEWGVTVTAVKAGTHEESLPCAFISFTSVIDKTLPLKYQWNKVDGAEAYNVYRGRNQKFGYIGQVTVDPATQPAVVSFNDDGQGPVYAETPPQNRDPFPDADSKPQVIGYYQNRFVGANAWNNPGGIDMSRTAEYKNFDRSAPPKAEDAVTLNVASHQYEEIRAVKALKHVLVVFTNGAEWAFTGSEGVITQDDWVSEPRSFWGCSWLEPLVIGDTIIFVQDVGGSVREFTLDEANGNDLTLVARHLFQGRKVVSWAYQHEPFRVIWAVMDDGALISCTYVKQREIWAWARHDTQNGKFESVCVVPEGTETALYASIQRTILQPVTLPAPGIVETNFRSIERMAPRVGINRTTGVFLDAAKTYTDPTTHITGLDHLLGREVYALVDGMVQGPYTVQEGDLGERYIDLTSTGHTVHVGLQITSQGATLDVRDARQEVRPRKKNIKRVWAAVQDTASIKFGQRFPGLSDPVPPGGEQPMPLLPWSMPATETQSDPPPGVTALAGLYTGLIDVNITSDWDDKGMVVWEQKDPLPYTILSIYREVDYGGR